MGDNQEARVGALAHFVKQIAETFHIRVIQWCVDLIENTNRRRIGHKHRKNQRQGRQGLLATRQQGQMLQLFAGGLA